MRINIPQLALAAALLSASAAYPQCAGRFCRPVDPWSSAGSLAPALDSPLSTLDSSSPHCRVFVGDGSVGSGTLIAKNGATGLVLTCSHLFDQSTSNIVVEFPDDGRYGARLIDRDPANDLAALLIQTPAATPLKVSDADPTGVLTACGYGGNGQFRPASGVVSGAAQAVGATFPSLKIGGAVRPGDSGGGVLDRAGRLVGVVWGCRDGETYLSCGHPLRNFLHRIRPQGERASASEPGRPRPRTFPDTDPQAWRSEIESRLTALDAKKQDRGEYLQVGDLNSYATKSEMKSTTTRIEQFRTAVFAQIDQRVSAANPGLLSGLSLGKLVAGALGLSGPVALAVIIAGGLASRAVLRPGHNRDRGRPGSLPIAVDSPPPPQQTIPESHYVPVQKDDFARAHQWAREQVARKYPGATEILSTLESLIKQQLAGTN